MTLTYGRGRALCAGAAILALIAFGAVPARADPAPGNAPTYRTSQGNIAAATGEMLVGFDSVSGAACRLGSTLTCIMPLDAFNAPFGGVTAMTSDGVAYAAGRSFDAICTVAGNVKLTFADGSQLTIPVAVGENPRPFALTSWSLSGVSGPATCTYVNFK